MYCIYIYIYIYICICIYMCIYIYIYIYVGQRGGEGDARTRRDVYSCGLRRGGWLKSVPSER